MSDVQRPRSPVQIGRAQGPTTELAEASSLIRVAEARARFGVRGAELSAAVLDTGLNTLHADFAGRIRAQLNLTDDNGGDRNNATDGDGHGTNVAGIIAAGADHVGMAPAAGVVPIKVLSNTGGGSFRSIARALEWVHENREKHQISVVNLSLGDGSNQTRDNDLLDDDIRRLIRTLSLARVAVVVAGGNDYFRHGSRQGMSYPAIIRECVSVGAVYDDDVGPMSYGDGATAFSTAADRLTPFTQRLHPTVSADCYTRIFAPGAPIRSSGLPVDGSPNGESVQDGTSQATPVVAGVILLMQQLHLRQTGRLPEVADLVDWLHRSGVSIFDGDDETDNVRNSQLSYRRVDALAALIAMNRTLEARRLRTALGLGAAVAGGA